MKVTRALQPFFPLCQRLLPDLRTLPGILNLSTLPNLPGLPGLPGLPSRLAGLSLTLLKATALDLAILAGHLLLYPSGIVQERRAAARPALPRAAGVADPAQLPTKAPLPVVLLHGFIDNRSVFVLLRRSLAQHGRHRVESLNYSPLTCDIRTAAELLGRHIEEICERTGSAQVDVVGHSLGGLIARYYVQRLGGDGRVRTLVTLGTPHSGTRVAPLANAHPIVRQMRPGSELIEELSRPAPGCRTQFVSFWSDLDHLMDPLESACVDHPDLLVQNVRVTGIGHLALPVHPAVATGIRQALDTAPAGASTGARTGGRAATRTGPQTDGLTVA
ncbi:esterase/lipase family protein [Streptomyces maremycinicus]|uniref:esterase/lipase family protein n=1 Tax=Streptomyces maremycinicus TaxID=1679753 RepID=UPI00078939F5|nr:alpha/beta fold hydrolase [Streptomyces sp. NBRC 110468]